MPNLPTIFVTDAQADRLLAAFGSVENYKAWLKATLIDYVVEHEDRVARNAWFEQQREKNRTLRQQLES